MVVLRLYNGISVQCEEYCTVLEEKNKNIFDQESFFFYFRKTRYGKTYPFGNVKQSCHLQIDNSFIISSFAIIEEITSALCAET